MHPLGFTVPEVDKIMGPYAEKSFEKYKKEYLDLMSDVLNPAFAESLIDKAEAYAMEKVQREMEQGYQGIEYKLNTVGSSRGDYPFVTFSFGLGTGKFEKMCAKTILNVHREGQGKKGFKRPVLFPKLVFLYDKNIHGEGKECNDVFEAGIQCSASNDIEKATDIIKKMIVEYGMNDEFGLLNLDNLDVKPEVITKEAVKLAKALQEQSLILMKENIDRLRDIAEELMKKETLTGEEIRKIAER